MGRDVLKISAVRIIGAVLTFIYSIILARTVSQEEFGVVQYFINFCQFFALIISGGFETTLVRFVPRYWRDKKFGIISNLRNQCYKTLLLNGLILSGAIAILWWSGVRLPINDGLFLILLATFGVLTTSLSSIHRDLMRSFGWVYRCIWPQSFWRTITTMVFTLLLFWFAKLDGTSAILAFCGGLMITLLIEILYLKSAGLPKQELAPDLVKQWKSVSRVIFAADIAHSALYRASGLLVGSLFGLEVAALYYAADRIATLTQFIGEGVQLAAGPKVSLAAQGTRQQLIDAVKNTSVLCFVSGIPMVVIMALVTPFILGAYAGNFHEAAAVTIVLVIGSAGYATFGPTPMIAGMIGLIRARLFVTLAAVVLQFSMIVIAFVIDDFLLAAIGVAISIWFAHGLLAFMIWRGAGIKTGIFSFSFTDILSFGHNVKTFVLSARDISK